MALSILYLRPRRMYENPMDIGISTLLSTGGSCPGSLLTPTFPKIQPKAASHLIYS